jgi:hypothetical protein
VWIGWYTVVRTKLELKPWLQIDNDRDSRMSWQKRLHRLDRDSNNNTYIAVTELPLMVLVFVSTAALNETSID